VRVNVPGKNSTEFCGSSPPGPIVIAQGKQLMMYNHVYIAIQKQDDVNYILLLFALNSL